LRQDLYFRINTVTVTLPPLRERSTDIPVLANSFLERFRSKHGREIEGIEPEAYRRLRGPPCTYIGHPLIDQIASLRPNAEERARREAENPLLLVLPGSRRSEVRHHMAIFGETLALLNAEGIAFEPVLATTPQLEGMVRENLKDWRVQPRIAVREAEKRAAFRSARAALAKSGTVTLELALAGVPMVAAYRVGAVEAFILRRAVKVQSVILANLVLGKEVVPEFLQENCTAEALAKSLGEVLTDTPLRQRQIEAFATLDSVMSTGGAQPNLRAAEIVLAAMRKGRRAS